MFTVGSLINEFTIFAEVNPENGVDMGGESRRSVNSNNKSKQKYTSRHFT